MRKVNENAREKKLQDSVILSAAIERRQHEALRFISYNERRSIADVLREAIDDYIKKDKAKKRNLKIAS